MAPIPKWALHIEDIRGTYVFIVTRGRSDEGYGSADDLDTCLDMARECYLECRKFRGELQS